MDRMELFLAGEWREASGVLEVRSPYDGRVVAEVARGDSEVLEGAADARPAELAVAFGVSAHEGLPPLFLDQHLVARRQHARTA